MKNTVLYFYEIMQGVEEKERKKNEHINKWVENNGRKEKNRELKKKANKKMHIKEVFRVIIKDFFSSVVKLVFQYVAIIFNTDNTKVVLCNLVSV